MVVGGCLFMFELIVTCLDTLLWVVRMVRAVYLLVVLLLGCLVTVACGLGCCGLVIICVNDVYLRLGIKVNSVVSTCVSCCL